MPYLGSWRRVSPDFLFERFQQFYEFGGQHGILNYHAREWHRHSTCQDSLFILKKRMTAHTFKWDINKYFAVSVDMARLKTALTNIITNITIPKQLASSIFILVKTAAYTIISFQILLLITFLLQSSYNFYVCLNIRFMIHIFKKIKCTYMHDKCTCLCC